MNGRPLSMRKKIQILVALTILAWATQTLLHQWARGAILAPLASASNANTPASIDTGTDDTVASPARDPLLSPAPPTAPADAAAPAPAPAVETEKFVPGLSRSGPGATIELKAEATILGPEVRLKQICRWSAADAPTFLPVADLIVTRIGDKTPYKSIGLEELQGLLRDARVNLSSIKFAGPLLCTVHRSDAPVEQKDALDQWIQARQGPTPAEAPASPAPAFPAPASPAPALPAPAAAPAVERAALPAAASLPARAPGAAPAVAAPPVAPAPPGEAPATRSLRQALTEDVAIRLNLPIEQLQLTFNPKDDRVLNLCEPQFRFNLEPTHVRNLGDVSWDVLVVHASGTQKVAISATARAWQRHLILNEPLSASQLIRAEDVTERRVLVDHLSDEPLLTAVQAVGQQASRDLKPGIVLTSRMVDSVPLVKAGQFVTITVRQGAISMKTVGRSMETGTLGQSVRVKSETTNDIYQVVLTAPQEGVVGGQGQTNR